MRSGEVLAMVLAGGEGKRLLPLTLRRCKPAVAFAGSLRLIDFTLFNCFASGLSSIHILVQYQAVALERHIADRWAPIAREEERALSCLRSSGSYHGTADAVFQNLSLLGPSGAEVVLVLSADHIYRADYTALVERHRESGADITVLTGRVPAAEASRFGVVSCDERGRMRQFVEKPYPEYEPAGGLCSINLGVYCFNREAASELLRSNALEASHDFGRDILPGAVQSMRVAACPLEKVSMGGDLYWRDVGTLESYFEAGMDLLSDPPRFQLEDSRWTEASPFYEWLPERVRAPAGSWNLIGSGAGVEGADLVDCIVSPGARVEAGARLERCIILPGAVVGRGTRLSQVIVDEGGQVPPWTVLGQPGRFPDGESISVVSGRGGEARSSALGPGGTPRAGLDRTRSAGAS